MHHVKYFKPSDEHVQKHANNWGCILVSKWVGLNVLCEVVDDRHNVSVSTHCSGHETDDVYCDYFKLSYCINQL